MSPTRPERPIVVGIDGSAGSRAALRFAFEEGLARGVGVKVVTAWMPGFPDRDAISERAFSDESARARRVQDDQVERVLDEMVERPEFTQIVLNDLSGPALVDLARDACLLVVGTGRKGAFARAFLGSVSEFCVRYSPVPVTVVPTASRAGDPVPRPTSVAWFGSRVLSEPRRPGTRPGGGSPAQRSRGSSR
jgi:nucleotide-binding universal stress UspA family protein